MMDELKKMMAGKKTTDGKMSDEEMQAKMDVIKELLDMATQAMGSDVKGGMDEMHKVSVMAPDQEGLEAGLDMAKDVADKADSDGSDPDGVEGMEEKMHMDLDGDNEKGEDPEHVAKVMGADDDEDEEDEMPNIFAQRREKMKNGRSGY